MYDEKKLWIILYFIGEIRKKIFIVKKWLKVGDYFFISKKKNWVFNNILN